jgi:hypothetical protein
MYVLDVHRLCHSEAKLATPKTEDLMSLKKLPPTAVNQKDSGFDRFSPRAFEWRFAFCLNRSGYLNAQNWPT